MRQLQRSPHKRGNWVLPKSCKNLGFFAFVRAQADLKRQAIHAHQVAYLAHEQQYWLKPEDINESIFERERRPVGWFPPKPKEDVPSR